jgi:polar amino acid transport system permease protein
VFPTLPSVLRERAPLRLRAWHGGVLAAIILVAPFAGYADAAPVRTSVFATLVKWTPLLLTGFGLNILISFLSMAIGTGLGLALGLGLISDVTLLRRSAWAVTQFFRNVPWLVLLFFMLYLLPFHVNCGPVTLTFPDWIKAVVGFALPVMANVAEIVRGAVRSIPPGQWEAAEALGFGRRQTVWLVMLPQAFRRMIPPWMNLYCILTTATTIASIVGVNDVVTLAGEVLGAEGGRTDLLAPLYAYVLLMFFIYTYPISLATQRLEGRLRHV